MKRLMIIGLWPDDAVNYCTEKCDCRRYAFDRILYHRGGRAARERICIPVVDRSGATTTYLDLPVTLLEAAIRELHARGPEIEKLYLDSKILPGELRALVMVSNCLEREFIHRQLATGQPLHMNVL